MLGRTTMYTRRCKISVGIQMSSFSNISSIASICILQILVVGRDRLHVILIVFKQIFFAHLMEFWMSRVHHFVFFKRNHLVPWRAQNLCFLLMNCLCMALDFKFKQFLFLFHIIIDSSLHFFLVDQIYKIFPLRFSNVLPIKFLNTSRKKNYLITVLLNAGDGIIV